MNVRFVNWYKTNIILCCCFFFGLVRLGYLRFAFCLNSKVACLAANSGGLLLYNEAVVHMYIHALQAKTCTYRIYIYVHYYKHIQSFTNLQTYTDIQTNSYTGHNEHLQGGYFCKMSWQNFFCKNEDRAVMKVSLVFGQTGCWHLLSLPQNVR